MSEVLFEKEGGVALLTLNRPERLNAISGPMLSELSERLIECDRDRDVRAIVITGAGRGFCAGLDLQDAASGSGIGGGGGGGLPPSLELRSAPPIVLHEIDKPTICALNGGAAGYGMDLALGCDMRIAGASGKLAAAFTRRGVLPESGGTWLLPRLIGWSKAAELIFTGRTLDADQCLELGLVSRVVPDALLLKEARALAEEIAGNAPLAVQASEAHDAHGPLRGLRRARAPRLPAAAAALPHARLPRGHAVLPREAPAALRRQVSAAG